MTARHVCVCTSRPATALFLQRSAYLMRGLSWPLPSQPAVTVIEAQSSETSAVPPAQDFSIPEGQLQAACNLARLARLEDLGTAILQAALPAVASLLQHGVSQQCRLQAASMLCEWAASPDQQLVRERALPALLALAQVRPHMAL